MKILIASRLNKTAYARLLTKLRQADLLSIFGHRSAVSEVLAGKRGITKEQAKKLADFFKLPVELFL